MIPGIFIIIAIICLLIIILGWIHKKPTMVSWWFLLGMEIGCISMWYTNNPDILEHFATKFIMQKDKGH
jgi:xanthine/uracil permease